MRKKVINCVIVNKLFISVWTIVDKGEENWRHCNQVGICNCTYLPRTINCWDAIKTQGIPSSIILPRDVEIMWDQLLLSLVAFMTCLYFSDLSKNSIQAIPPLLFDGFDRLMELWVWKAKIFGLVVYLYFQKNLWLWTWISSNIFIAFSTPISASVSFRGI